MRYKGLSVCLIALLVFFGLRSVMKRVEPRAVGQPALLDSAPRPLASGTHLASLASLAAGALAFAVIPGRPRQAAPRGNSSSGNISTRIRTRVQKITTQAAARAAARRVAPPAPTPTIPDPVLRCPRCDRSMNSVLVNSGEHRGRTMWLCPQSPDCEVRPLTRRRRPIFVPHAS